MKKVLSQKFFERPVVEVAQSLLGKFLVRKIGKKEIALMVVEVEAYDGQNDKACHAHKGRTKRTEEMFGPAGHFYIYLCYGMYWMLNIVTGPKDYPAAVLLRGAQQLDSHNDNNDNNNDGKNDDNSRGYCLNGPGKLTKALKVDKKLNSRKALPQSGLWFEDRGVIVKKSDIKKTPRIGVSYAGPTWSKKHYRFVLIDNPNIRTISE